MDNIKQDNNNNNNNTPNEPKSKNKTAKIVIIVIAIVVIAMICVMLSNYLGKDEKSEPEVDKITQQQIEDFQDEQRAATEAAERAQKAATKDQIALAQDEVGLEINNIIMDMLADKYASGNFDSDSSTRGEHVLDSFSEGVSLDNFYAQSEDDKIIVYASSDKEEVITEGTVDDNGNIEWD